MAVVFLLLGAFVFAMGAWGFTHPERSGDATGGWLSFPGGRRVGGIISMLLGIGIVATVPQVM